MNRRHFLSHIGTATVCAPTIISAIAPPSNNQNIDRLKLSHHYPGAYHLPNDLWTPEEIEAEGFIFVEHPVFIHQYNDPRHPIMKSSIGYGNDLDPKDPNLHPMVCKTRRFCPCYIKTYDIDAGRRRGIESVNDYLGKKDIFKPMIITWMKEHEYHYVHRVMIEDSPCIYIDDKLTEKCEGRPWFVYMYAVNVRGCKLPVKV